MNRSLLLAAALSLAGAGIAARAQTVPAPSPPTLIVNPTAEGITIRAVDVELEHLLGAIGDRFGIVVSTDEPLTGRVSVRLEEAPLGDALRRILGRRSFLLRYAGLWHGELAESPNRLRILADGASGNVRILNAADDPAAQEAEQLRVLEAIARIDEAAMSSVGDPSLELAVLAVLALNDASESVREEAVYAVGAIDDRQSLAVLEQALADPDPDVREAAVIGLGASSDPLAIAVLMRTLADASPGVREAAVLSLAELDSDEAIDALRIAADSADEIVRTAASELLDEGFD